MPDTPIKPLSERSAADLRALAERCADKTESGFTVHPASVETFVAALRALAREKDRGG